MCMSHSQQRTFNSQTTAQANGPQYGLLIRQTSRVKFQSDHIFSNPETCK